MRRRLELDDLYRLPFCSDPRLSPDGSRVAFVVTTADRDKDCNRSSIWMVAADGSSSARQLTFGERDSAPRWSPDGRWLAFVAARGDKPKPAGVAAARYHAGHARRLFRRRTRVVT